MLALCLAISALITVLNLQWLYNCFLLLAHMILAYVDKQAGAKR